MSGRTVTRGGGRRADRRSELARCGWIATALVPFGWLAWTGFLYAGIRVHRARWILAGVGYLVLTTAFIVLLGVNGTGDEETGSETLDQVATWGSIVMWGVALVHALAIRKEFLYRLDLRGRLEDHSLERRVSLELAASRPRDAAELGLGRPDVYGAHDGGLVDVNNASERALAQLPGVGDRTAHRIAVVRERIDGFSSLEDMGMVLDLPAPAVEKLRGRVIFLPR